MKALLTRWLRNLFPRHRLMPTNADVRSLQDLYRAVFDNPNGYELLELWLETIVLANPRSVDPTVCVVYAAQCAMVEDVIKALDGARDPVKYETMTRSPTIAAFDPRKAA